MITVIGVRFRTAGKIYYFDPAGRQIKTGDHVIVETARGIEYGYVVLGNREVDESKVVPPLKSVIRMATDEDEAAEARNKQKERDAFKICQEKIKKHHLDMKLIDAEYTFDNNKVLFYFTADGRIDFRELVKDLASVFKTRIELRQVGVRDETKIMGGIGICGRALCCHSYLSEFIPVSIKMAKEQNLSLNPTKISGTCGRLMCCLKYEQEAYEDLVKHAPKQESFVETPDGAGTVSSVNLLRQTVQVRLESAPETPKCYHNCELCVIRNGKGKRPEGYVEPPLEQLAQLRRKVEDAPEEKREFSGEGSSLAAALEEVFSRREESQTPPPPAVEQEGGEERRERRRRRRPRGERRTAGEQEGRTTEDRPRQERKEQRPQEIQSGEGQPKSAGTEGSEKRNSRRRRRRPRGGSGPRSEQPQE